MSTTSEGPLAGVRVIELGTTIMTPYAGQRLGDLGADVIKIESFAGDPNRLMASGAHPELSGVALGLHRNKRSIALDLKHPEGNRIARALVDGADVVITNHRVAALERLGLDDASVRGRNPRLVYVEAHSFSVESGEDGVAAYDDTVQALTALARLGERTGSGVGFVPTLVADKVAGLAVVEAVLAALVHRGVSGRGQRVDVPMFDATLAFTLVEHLALAAYPGGEAGYSRILTAQRGPHRTSDGWVALMPYTDRHWRDLYTEVGHAALLEGPSHASAATRLRDADTIYAELKTVVVQRPTAYWLDVCRRLDVPVADVPTLQEVVEQARHHRGVVSELDHPIAGRHRSVAQPLRFHGTPTRRIPRPAPHVGADARDVLAGIGIDEAGLTALVDAGAVRDPERSSQG